MSAATLQKPLPALAIYKTCDGHVVSNNVTSCPDGSIPMEHAGELTPSGGQTIRPHAGGTITPGPSAQILTPCPRGIYGKFVTNPQYRVGRLAGLYAVHVPGAAYTNVREGMEYMHTSAGAASDALSIAANGTYVWGGSRGRVRYFAPNRCATGYGYVYPEVERDRRGYYIKYGSTIGLYNIATGYLEYQGNR